jgi:hypothetical protein
VKRDEERELDAREQDGIQVLVLEVTGVRRSRAIEWYRKLRPCK